MVHNSPEEDYSEKQFNDNVNKAEVKTEKKVSEVPEIKEETPLAAIKSNEQNHVVSLNKNNFPEAVKDFQEDYSEKRVNCKQCGETLLAPIKWNKPNPISFFNISENRNKLHSVGDKDIKEESFLVLKNPVISFNRI